MSLKGINLLDIGCGGGLLLNQCVDWSKCYKYRCF